MKCPVHIGTEMVERTMQVPFIRLEAEGRQHFTRKEYHCPIPGCKRVQVGEGHFYKPKNWREPSLQGHA